MKKSSKKNERLRGLRRQVKSNRQRIKELETRWVELDESLGALWQEYRNSLIGTGDKAVPEGLVVSTPEGYFISGDPSMNEVDPNHLQNGRVLRNEEHRSTCESEGCRGECRTIDSFYDDPAGQEMHLTMCENGDCMESICYWFRRRRIT